MKAPAMMEKQHQTFSTGLYMEESMHNASRSIQSQPRTHKHLKRMNDVPNHGNRVIAPGGSQTELLHMSVPLHGFG